MRHVKLVVEYDGTSLCGWQRQANGPTVQDHLETALAQLLQHPTAVLGASRTDAGVHARGQVASFRTERAIPLVGIRRGLNTMLPEAIAVVDAQDAADDFHPRLSARGKHYRYAIVNRRERSPLLRDRAWHHAEPLALPRMREAAAELIGEHDFAAFRAAGCSANTTMRRIDAIEIGRVREAGEDELVVVDVRGNAFLRHMVRIVVGTLAEVGTGGRTAANVREVLAARDRTRAGITAPPQGLTLMEVFYGTGTGVGRA